MGEGGTDREDAPKRSAEWRKLTDDLLCILGQQAVASYTFEADRKRGGYKRNITGAEYRLRSGTERKWQF